MDHDEYVEDDLGSSVSSYTDEVQLSRSMENGNFTCGLLIFFFLLYTLKKVQIRKKGTALDYLSNENSPSNRVSL